VHPIELLYRAYGLDHRQPGLVTADAQPTAVHG
jgi:hypothetical protein